MKKLLALLLFTSTLFANITVVKTPIPLGKSFEVNSSVAKFDTSLNYTHQALLNCQPKLSAVYKIKSEKKLKVIPTENLKSATTYGCSYKGQNFSFTTEPFSLLEANYFPKEKILRLNFNDSVNEKTLSKGIQFTKLDKLAKTNLKYKVLQSNESTFVLQITEKVGTSPIQLTVNQKLQNIHGNFYAKEESKLFNSKYQPILLDPKKKALTLTDTPQMVTLNNGEFALRIFIADNLSGKSENAIAIEGIEDFKVGSYKYMSYKMRKRYNIQNAYYYHDITSKEFQPNTTYKVTLKKGLKTYYNELKEDTHYSLKTGNRAKVILFNDDKPYISNKGELGFSSINIDSATLIVERILDDNLRYFVNFNAAKKNKMDGYTKEVFNKEVVFNQKPNKRVEQKFKLSDLSKETLPVGAYKVTLRYDELIDEKKEERSASKILFLSNLGISANVSKTQAFVSVFSLTNTDAINEASVEIYGENNELLGHADTNKQGVAIVNYKENDLNPPKGIIVRKGKELNFLALNKNISSPTLNQIYKQEERFKAHVHFQSNIVRPKAKVNALITVKDRDFISASKLPVKVVFQELYGKVVKEKIHHTDNVGLIDFEYQLDANDRIGNYQLNVYLGEKLLGSKKLKVEAFMPPKIENSITTKKKSYYIDELMDVNIRSSYLFGAPASGLQGKVTFNAQTLNYTNPKYKGYSFSNEQLKKSNVGTYIDRSENIVLDEKGEYKMVMSNQLKQKVPSILEGMIGATIMDDAQPVSSYQKVMLYPYKAMVGLHLKNTSLKKGEKLEGTVVLIDPENNTTIKRELFASIKEVKWHYNYSDGHYNWEKEVNVVESFKITSNQSFSRELGQNGDYVLEVHDRLGGHSASQSFDLFTWNYANISPDSNLKSVEIDFEDKLYNKGDMLDVKIKSPILEGKLLLTLEGEKVQNHQVLSINKGVAKTSLKIKEDMGRGLYLHASVIRATDSDSKLIPFRATGYKFVKANREAHKVDVKMDVPKVSKSKERVTVKLKTSKPTKVLLSVVDTGILQLVGQKTPTIFDYFNEQPNKKISYFDLYDQLMTHIAEGTLMDFGAGDMLRMKKKHVAPDLGKRVKPFMYWSGIVETKEGQTAIDFKIPEFNGKATLLAIAINEDSIGVQSQEMEIKDDIMIKPSYPRYGLVGDRFDVPVRVFNTTATPQNVKLSTNTLNNVTLSLAQDTLEIPANSSKVISMKVEPTQVGKGVLQLIATYNNKTVTKSVELPILSPYALSTKTFKGITNNKETFTVPSEYLGGKAYINLSDNLIGALRDDLKYLISYPYGCAEQTASKLSAIHFAKPFLKEDKFLQNAKHFTLQGVKKLDNMQNYYGEFSYWEGGSNISAYASLYAAQTLLDIGELREGLKKKTLKMLKSVATQNGNYQGSYSKFHQLYAAYILAENNELTKSTANMLYENKTYKGHFLASFYMAGILKSLGEEEKAKLIYTQNSFDLLKYGYKSYGNVTGNFESNVRDMMLHFIIKTKYFGNDKGDLKAIQKEISNLNSTQEKAMALKAISTYLGQPKHTKLDATVTVNAKSTRYTKPTFIEIDNISNETITLTPKGNAAYTIELVKNLPKPIKNELSTQKPMSLKQEFINASGMPVDLDNLRQGDKLFAKTSIVNYGKINHVVVSQRVPSCLSIVNNKIKNQKDRFKNQNINLEHKEIHDDRILHFIHLKDKKVYNKGLKKNLSIENKGVIYTELLASTVGECKLPATIAEAMYNPQINDYAKVANRVTVKPLTDSNQESNVQVASAKDDIKMEATKLVKEFYTKEMNSNNELEFVKFFHFPIETYFRKNNFTKESLIKDKRDYFKEWSKRLYSNLKTKVIHYTKPYEKLQIKVSFNYKLYNGKKFLEGESNHIVTLQKKENGLFIISIELEKV
jgi:uncharacterized protein YfaS (alpha-2-macroglobulin family)